jgi:hypothetical protein
MKQGEPNIDRDTARLGGVTEALTQARLTGALDMFRIMFNWAADDLKQPENLRKIAAELNIPINLLTSVTLLILLDRNRTETDPDTIPDEIAALLVHYLPHKPPHAKRQTGVRQPVNDPLFRIT